MSAGTGFDRKGTGAWARTVYPVSRIEFMRVWAHVLTPALIVLLGVFAALDGLTGLRTGGGNSASLYVSFGTNFISSAIFYGIVSVFIGVTSIAEERRNHAIHFLLSKPMYRRDLIVGKVVGLNIYMLSIITLAMTLTAVLLIISYAMPVDPVDFMIRVFLYIFILFIYSSLHIALAMLTGIVVKDLLIAASLMTAFIFFDWYYNIFGIIPGMINFDPQAALCHFYINKMASLQSTSSTIGQWIDANVVNLFFFVAAIIILLLMCMTVYTREEIR